MRIRVFINEPEITVNIPTGTLSTFKTREALFEYVRGLVRKELANPKMFRIPAQDIERLAKLYDRVDRSNE